MKDETDFCPFPLSLGLVVVGRLGRIKGTVMSSEVEVTDSSKLCHFCLIMLCKWYSERSFPQLYKKSYAPSQVYSLNWPLMTADTILVCDCVEIATHTLVAAGNCGEEVCDSWQDCARDGNLDPLMDGPTPFLFATVAINEARWSRKYDGVWVYLCIWIHAICVCWFWSVCTWLCGILIMCWHWRVLVYGECLCLCMWTHVYIYVCTCSAYLSVHVCLNVIWHSVVCLA